MSIKEKTQRLISNIPTIYICLKKKETPLVVKILSFVVVAYALSPIDLIPDFVPLLGQLDDILILPILITIIIKLIPLELWQKCKEESKNLWKEGKPKKWYYAFAVIVIWFFVIMLVII